MLAGTNTVPAVLGAEPGQAGSVWEVDAKPKVGLGPAELAAWLSWCWV